MGRSYEVVSAFGGELWEDIRAMTASVGDVTPLGPIENIEYLGEIGVYLTIDDREFYRGRDALISRKVR